jgi:hypothetical protein
MSTQPSTSVLPPDRFNEALDWIQAALSRIEYRLTGTIVEVHARPWSKVLRVPTDRGNLFFKAVAPFLADEVSLSLVLMNRVPAVTLPVLAADETRGWLLLPDGGPQLRAILHVDRDLTHWDRVLAIYAQAQIDLAPHVIELLATGIPDRRLLRIPNLYKQLIEQAQRLEIESDERLSDDEFRRLRNLSPHVERLCLELSAYPLPESLHHGDLHDGNVFLPAGRPLFFDWGDASISHPFVSLRTVFVSVEITFDLPDGGASDYSFRDAYLQPWTGFAPAADLLSAFRLAQHIAPLVSALSWHRAVAPLPAPARGREGLAVHNLLREFMDGVVQARDTLAGWMI